MVRYRDLVSDTICSPITAPGFSGVAVIRVSGDQALSLTDQLTQNSLGKISTHTSRLCPITDTNKQTIDQVLVTYFEKGKSFTGDETVEISCHGNPLIINKITESFLNMGCRAAEKGEFSFRAFYNGKIDLVQAESIHNLVTTKSFHGSEAALDQLKGKLSQHFSKLEETLVEALGQLEASIDFVEQDIETASFVQVRELVQAASSQTQNLLDSYDTGKSLNESFKILLLGSTNVGKSSLFNRILEKDRAIVTDVPGTTRDMVSESLFIGNYPVEFFDSAGLRDSENQVENIGMAKGLEFSQKADLIFYVVDLANPEKLETLQDIDPKKLFVLLNKSDLVSSEQARTELQNWSDEIDKKMAYIGLISAHSGQGLETLIEKVREHIEAQNVGTEQGLVTQARHYNHLLELKNSLHRAISLISLEESPDLISQELQLGLSEINSLLGKEYNDEILDKIFSDFCIGK